MKVKIPEKSVEVKEEADVLVIGGGPAGISAAVAASRSGSKTILVEGRGFLGGNITGSYVDNCNWFINNKDFKVTGIYSEIRKGYRRKYGRSHFVSYLQEERYNAEYLKIYLDEFVLGAGVKLYLHTLVNDLVIEGNGIKYVVLQTKKGPAVIGAKVVIDATGDGDIAFHAGVPYKMGRNSDGLCQPATMSFRIAGVDVEKFRQFPENVRKVREIMLKLKAADPGALSCKRDAPAISGLTDGGVVSQVNYADVYMIDPTDVDQVTRGEVEARKYIDEVVEFFRKNIDGMEHVELVHICPYLSFRDSRRIMGQYELTLEDIESDASFDDAIARFPRFYDMLSLDGDWSDPESELDQDAKRLLIVPDAKNVRSFQIPYRCLVPVKMDNLLVSGRCISSDHIAESSIRAIFACMQTGQAAGCAASISIADNTKPRDVDVRKLQAMLKQQGLEF